MLKKYTGCLLGLAVGDALGAAVEFLKLGQIKEKYGASGIKDFDSWRGFKAGSYTDDTQMSIATAEGLIKSAKEWKKEGTLEPTPFIYKEYLRWLKSQDNPSEIRAPGNTCLSSLRSGEIGSMKKPLNNSKGCGGVMRVAPVGLAFERDVAFYEGVNAAALTHGHPSGYLSAGFLAELISYIIEERDLRESVKAARETLVLYPSHEETLAKVDEALRLVEEKLAVKDSIYKIGEGWIGEEALAISLFCSLKFADNFSLGVQAAVNHSGDSDSTGSITGSILGAKLGEEAIPKQWTAELENAEYVQDLGEEMFRIFKEHT